MTRPDTHGTSETPPTPKTFMSVRTAVILLTATIVGLMIGLLTAAAGNAIIPGVLAGSSSAGAAVVALDRLLGS